MFHNFNRVFCSVQAPLKTPYSVNVSKVSLSAVHITDQQWGFNTITTKDNSRGKGWWKRKEVFIQVLHNLGEWRTPHFRFISSTQRGQSSQLQQVKNKRQCPELLLHFKVMAF